MERKLSQKAAQMRQRFTLKTRNSTIRDRASTLDSSRPASSASHRSRSATTPISSAGVTWDNEDPTRYYHFTDEPGFFRPETPLLERQEIEEQVEDDVKHACALLVHSIDRGLPMWPSLDVETHRRPNSTARAQASPPETQPNFQDYTDFAQPLENAIPPHKGQYDSGVGMSLQSPGKMGRVGQNSFSATTASASTGRFYGKCSMSPPMEEFERGRARGRSFATDSTAESRSRSRSSSPAFFPYSPPQLDLGWGFGQEPRPITAPVTETMSPSNTFLGAEGMAWLHGGLDGAGMDDVGGKEDHAGMVSAPSTALGPPNALPRRFYSTRKLPSESRSKSRDWAGFDVCESRDSIIHTSLSMQSIGVDDEEKHAHDFAYPIWDEQDSDSDSFNGFDNHQGFYSLRMPGEEQEPTPQRRRKASQLLKKLTGLGTRRKETEVVDKRLGRAVAV